MENLNSYLGQARFVITLILFFKTSEGKYCKPGEIFYCEGQCLSLSPPTSYATYDNARSFCFGAGNSKLVDTPNEYKWEFVRHHVTKGIESWLGLEKEGILSTSQPWSVRTQAWTWESGSKFSTTWNRWAPGEGTSQMPLGVSACASFDKDGYWTDAAKCRVNEEAKRRFICQRAIYTRTVCPSNPKDLAPEDGVTKPPPPVVTTQTEEPETVSAVAVKDEEEEEGGIFDNFWVLAGLGVAGLVLIVLVIIAAVFICRRSRRSDSKSSRDPEIAQNTGHRDKRGHTNGAVSSAYPTSSLPRHPTSSLPRHPTSSLPRYPTSSLPRPESGTNRRPPPPEPIIEPDVTSPSQEQVISAVPLDQDGGRSLRREVPLPPIADPGYELLPQNGGMSPGVSTDGAHDVTTNTVSRENSTKDKSKRDSIGKRIARRLSRKSGKTANNEFVPMPMQRPRGSVNFKPNFLPARRAPTKS